MLVPAALQHLCVFGLTLHAALSWPEALGQRTVDVVELWCGVGSIAAAAVEAGYVVRKFDKFRVPGVTDTAGCSQKTFYRYVVSCPLSAVCSPCARVACCGWGPCAPPSSS